MPELPRLRIDTTYALPTAGTTHRVFAGDDLQVVLDAAQPGDIIELEAGATFVGNFWLPSSAGDEWIYIRSSAHENLPSEGTRVTPADADLMPKFVSPNSQPAISFDGDADHYRFVGVEVTTTSPIIYNLILLGFNRRMESATSTDQLPHHIVFDRSYIHGIPNGYSQRGIALNSAHSAVVDSYLSELHTEGVDAQAIASWNGTGPFKLQNNYIEGAGENLLFGGALPSIEGLIPSDIEIRGNHFSKPMSWREGHPDYAGKFWQVKNLFEVKNGQRILVEGNVLENVWVGAQHAFAIVLTPRGEGGRGPWMGVQDVTIRNNVIRNAGAAFHITSADGLGASAQTRNILIENNLMYNINVAFRGHGTMLLAMGAAGLPPIDGLTVRHNTFIHYGPGTTFVTLGDSGTVALNFVFSGNIVTHGSYGLHGANTGVGEQALLGYTPGFRVSDNLIILGEEGQQRAHLYPAGFSFVDEIDDVGFVDYENGDFRIEESSPFSDIGADIDALPDTGGGSNMYRATATWTPGLQYVQSQTCQWWANGEMVSEATLGPGETGRTSSVDGIDFQPGDAVELKISSLNSSGVSSPLVISGTTPFPVPDAPTNGTMEFQRN